MFYDTFDNGFGMMPSFDSGFGSPMFNGTGCFPAPAMDMGFNGGFAPTFDPNFGMPMTCGYSPAPFGCNPVSMDFSGNVCIDGIPITPNTPPAWMTARAAQAEMHLNELEMQLNDPNFWMNFIPQGAFNPPTFDWSTVDWQSMPIDTPASDASASMPFDSNHLVGLNPQMGMDMAQSDGIDTSTPMWRGEEVLPCGLTQSQYDQCLERYQKNLADNERLLEQVDYSHPAQRAMIQNNIASIKRNIRDLDKPLGKI